MSRVVELPECGRLFVATDIQGNVDDFHALETQFRQAAAQPDGAVLVVTGDLVHGPEIPEHHWPDYLGSYYHADSATVLQRAKKLADDYPGCVYYLLGNHEHAHIGGPVVSKFFANEALRLERIMGPERTRATRDWLFSWPLVAVAKSANILMSHGAPNAVLDSPADLDGVRLDPPGGAEGIVDELLAELLWARTATAVRARAFLDVFDPELQVAIYGHDVARSGYTIDREPLLCISTSFGCYDGDKLYLDWDLSERAECAHEVAERGLRPLYPDASPVFRKPGVRNTMPYP